MAVEIKFLDAIEPEDYIKLSKDYSFIHQGNFIIIESVTETDSASIWLDKPTAIKLKKQLGTLINQITIEEAKDGKG